MISGFLRTALEREAKWLQGVIYKQLEWLEVPVPSKIYRFLCCIKKYMDSPDFLKNVRVPQVFSENVWVPQFPREFPRQIYMNYPLNSY